MANRRVVLLGVSTDQSIELMGPLPTALAARDWQVHVASNPGPFLASLAERNGTEIRPIAMRRQPSIVRDFRSLLAWLGAVGSTRPDLVCIATPKASLLGLIASWAFRVPVRVYWLWGLRLETVRGLAGALLYILERITAKCATHIVAVSPSLAKLYVEKSLASEEKLIVLGSGSSRGVDLRRFRPPRRGEGPELEKLAIVLGLKPQVPIIGIVGRQHKDKGFELLLEALEHPVMSGVDCQILVVGADESRGRFRELSSLLGTHIVFARQTQEIEQYYRLMNVMCLPSLREGLPNVVLESLASGTPVITTTATGAVDSVEDEVVGLLVPRGSAEGLALALQRILTDTATHTRLASQARSWVKARFAEADVVNLHVDLFDLLISASGPDNHNAREA